MTKFKASASKRTMFACALVLLAALQIQAQTHYAGVWHGQVMPARDALMKEAKTPEHKKLLLYTMDRLEASKAVLLLRSDATFVNEFDDGYPPDRLTMTGTWAVSGGEVRLTPSDARFNALALNLDESGKKLRLVGELPKRIPILFSRVTN